MKCVKILGGREMEELRQGEEGRYSGGATGARAHRSGGPFIPIAQMGC